MRPLLDTQGNHSYWPIMTTEEDRGPDAPDEDGRQVAVS